MTENNKSRPSRARGLKRSSVPSVKQAYKSRPSRARGLKPDQERIQGEGKICGRWGYLQSKGIGLCKTKITDENGE